MNRTLKGGWERGGYRCRGVTSRNILNVLTLIWGVIVPTRCRGYIVRIVARILLVLGWIRHPGRLNGRETKQLVLLHNIYSLTGCEDCPQGMINRWITCTAVQILCRGGLGLVGNISRTVHSGIRITRISFLRLFNFCRRNLRSCYRYSCVWKTWGLEKGGSCRYRTWSLKKGGSCRYRTWGLEKGGSCNYWMMMKGRSWEVGKYRPWSINAFGNCPSCWPFLSPWLISFQLSFHCEYQKKYKTRL